jgi:hypothetical protein
MNLTDTQRKCYRQKNHKCKALRRQIRTRTPGGWNGVSRRIGDDICEQWSEQGADLGKPQMTL